MKDLGCLSYFLDIVVTHHAGGLFLSQRKYAKSIIIRVGMVSCNSSSTPIDTKSRLSSSIGSPCDNLISWSSKHQGTLSRSSVEAEYRGVANVVSKAWWLRNLLLEFHHPLTTASIVYCDNISAIYLSKNPVQHQRTKHVELDIHFVREKVALGQVRVLHVPSK
ncbi:hypothetical protein LIER_39681 [Lithospermum erythrorhizon]|uniref:Uncharacterized protein n=1 Tax=Lithospermum erythrorhizon TaxID=34254 RepID=A0AAV3QLM7_LITER